MEATLVSAVNVTRIVAAEAHNDSLLPGAPNSAPQDASRRARAHDFELHRAATLLRQLTTQCLTLVHVRSVLPVTNAQAQKASRTLNAAKDWRHESRRPDKATTVKLTALAEV